MCAIVFRWYTRIGIIGIDFSALRTFLGNMSCHYLQDSPSAIVTVELAKIITRSAGILNIRIDEEGALELASRSRGTPRIANRLLKRVRDFSEVIGDGIVNLEVAQTALDKLEIDELGLDQNDRRMLNAMIKYYRGGPVGLETLAAAIGEEAVTIEDVYEPYLMQIGFLSRTPRGRCVTAAAYEHLGYQVPSGTAAAQGSLFD